MKLGKAKARPCNGPLGRCAQWLWSTPPNEEVSDKTLQPRRASRAGSRDVGWEEETSTYAGRGRGERGCAELGGREKSPLPKGCLHTPLSRESLTSVPRTPQSPEVFHPSLQRGSDQRPPDPAQPGSVSRRTLKERRRPAAEGAGPWAGG